MFTESADSHLWSGVDIHGTLLFRTLIGKVRDGFSFSWNLQGGGWFLESVSINWSSYVLQIFGSIGSVGGGLALGKEGPLVHTGACIASLLGQVSTNYLLYVSICIVS